MRHQRNKKGRNKPGRRKPAEPSRDVSGTIREIGRKGDGLLVDETGEEFHIPHTAPGDLLSAKVTGTRGEIIAIETPSDLRRTPPCPHSGTCGGCSQQHIKPDVYAEWKEALFDSALARFQIRPENRRPAVRVAEGDRRRVSLTAEKRKGKVQLGYQAAKSHDLVDIDECLLVSSRINEVLPGFRALAADHLMQNGERLRVQITQTSNGLACFIDPERAGLTDDLTWQAREAIGAWAKAQNVIQLSLEGDLLVQTETPYIELGAAKADLPDGAFLQACASAEDEMRAFISSHLERLDKKHPHLLDLFCGLGTFAFGASRFGTVDGYDSVAVQIDAMNRAAARAQLAERVVGHKRDLMDAPLIAKEMQGVDVVIIDPPRAGAAAQTQEIAESTVPLVLSISCNPMTFARDARTLLDAGFKCVEAGTIDQFLYSAHLECVGAFVRG